MGTTHWAVVGALWAVTLMCGCVPAKGQLVFPFMYEEVEMRIPDEGEFLCVDCGDVDVDDEGALCGECWQQQGEWQLEDSTDNMVRRYMREALEQEWREGKL